jgi:hypothetical protein
MKNGKVLAKLALDKRVKWLNLTSDNEQVSIALADGYYVPKAPRDFVNTFRTAKAAHQFIKSALKIPTPRDGHKLVVNMMTGKLVEEPIDTPYACSVASESYWCS